MLCTDCPLRALCDTDNFEAFVSESGLLVIFEIDATEATADTHISDATIAAGAWAQDDDGEILPVPPLAEDDEDEEPIQDSGTKLKLPPFPPGEQQLPIIQTPGDQPQPAA